jgi:hypothetical protein
MRGSGGSEELGVEGSKAFGFEATPLDGCDYEEETSSMVACISGTVISNYAHA